MGNEVNITKEVMKNSRKQFIIKTIVSIILRGSLLIIPILYSYAINAISSSDFMTAYMMIGISFLVTIIYRLSEYFNQVTYYNLYNKIYNNFTDKALSYTYKNSIYSLSRIKLGEFINIFNNDIDVMTTFWASTVIRIIMFLELLFIYGYFYVINLYIGIITTIISIIVLFIMLKYGKKIELLSTAKKDTLDKKTSILQEIFLGMKEIKSLNIIPSMNKRSELSNDTYLHANAKYNIGFNANRNISLFIIEFFRLALFIYGIYLISVKQMELGVLLIIYNYYSKLIDNLTEVANVNVEFRNLHTSNKRFNKLLEYSRKTEDKCINIHSNPEGEIVLKEVLYGDRHDPYLKNISITFKPKNINVVTGKTGSDKPGLIDLLLRLNRQHEGEILIDGTDIFEYGDDEYYDLVSSAREHTVFFNVSIKDNLSIIEPEFPKIVEVCKMLNIHNDILNLKNGYDTILSDGIDNVNINIKRALSIARVLLKDSKIMFFDDIISSFDDEMIDLIMNILDKKKRDHNIIIVSRNSNVLKHADNIFVVENGILVTEKNVLL